MSINKKHLSLIEILVVIAIISILVSFLIPALSKARKKARNIVCINQQKQIYFGFTGFSDDNEGIIPPSWMGGYGPNDSWAPISFDDYIGDYLGRPTDIGLKRQQHIFPSNSSSSVNKIFRCPIDDVASYNGAFRRSYSVNGGIARRVNPITFSQLSYPSGTILMTELPLANGHILGKDGYSGVWTPQIQLDVGGYNYHAVNSFNYLFSDGHAKILSTYATVGDGDIVSPLGMWTEEKSD